MGKPSRCFPRAITLAGRNPGRWINLIDPLTRFASAERALAVAGLHDTLASIGEEERKPLWAKLRAEIDRHERFNNVPWALPAEELAPLRTLTEKYAPTDPIANLVLLFDREDFDANLDCTKVIEGRAAALKQLYADGGAEAIIRLVSEVRVPYWVVEAAAAARLSEVEIEELLSLSLERCPDSGFAVGLSMLYRKLVGAARAEQWLKQRHAASAEVLARLLQGWPDGLDTGARYAASALMSRGPTGPSASLGMSKARAGSSLHP